MTDIEIEYSRIRGLFDDCDEKTLALLEGLFMEAARTRIELNKLNSLVKKTGLVIFNPKNPNQQKELPVSKALPKVRASYANTMFKLSAILGKNVTDDDPDGGLKDYE